jgi:hypothetical protein
MIVTDKQLRKHLQTLCKQVGSQRAWGRKHKIGASIVSDVINGRRDFTPSMLKVLKAKRLKHYEVPVMKFEDIE